jgi:c-di-GMP-binding flagellar brake protein YcgR
MRRRLGLIQSDGAVVKLWTYDLSRGGMQVFSEYAAERGQEFGVFFSIFDPVGKEYERIDARVKVAHVLYDGAQHCYRIGLQFTNFRGNCREMFERCLEFRMRLQMMRQQARLY